MTKLTAIKKKQIHNYLISNYPISWNCGMIIQDHHVSSQDRYFLSRTSFTYINQHPGFGIFLKYTYKIFNGKSAQNQSKVWIYLYNFQTKYAKNQLVPMFIFEKDQIHSIHEWYIYLHLPYFTIKNNHSCG